MRLRMIADQVASRTASACRFRIVSRHDRGKESKENGDGRVSPKRSQRGAIALAQPTRSTAQAHIRLLLVAALLSVLTAFPVPCFGEESRGITVVATNEESGQWEEVRFYRKTYAVIIGIDQYPNLTADRQLTYAVSDAKAVERMLTEKFVFNKIHTLYNEQATREGILDVFLKDLADLTHDDALFVFFAGHAGQEKTAFGDVGFLVTYDGGFGSSSKNISMTTIRDDISKRVAAKHIFYVMDCCYGGLLLATRDVAEPRTQRNVAYLRQVSQEAVRQVLCAGDANQTVLDSGPGGHSVFTGRFLEALDASDDFITASELSAVVKERVFADAQARNHKQAPKDGELFGLGDFVFLPSTTKRQETIAQQIAGLEEEIVRYGELERRAKEIRDGAARREAERNRQEAEAKLKARQLEGQRLLQEQQRKEEEAEKRRNRDAEEKRLREQEEDRLARLREEVTAKRSGVQDLTTSDWAGAVREMQSLDRQLSELRDKHLEELRQRILTIARAESEKPVTVQKDEFETQQEYEQRLRNAAGHAAVREKSIQAEDTIKASYDALANPLLEQMVEISEKTYRLVGDGSVAIELGTYSAEREAFSTSLHPAEMEKPILDAGKSYYRLTRVEAQAARVGMKPGDIVLTYDGKPIHVDGDIDKAKNAVRSNQVVMTVLRDATVHRFTLKPGHVGYNAEQFKADSQSLSAAQFLASGWLKVPRNKARQFKQDYLNGFVHGEVTVCVPTPLRTLPIQATAVDDSNDERYDLFAYRFVSCGNSMTYDDQLKIFWAGRTDLELSQQGAALWLRRRHWQGFSDWRLATLDELKAVRRSLGGFYTNEYHTSTNSSKTGNDMQINMKDGRVYNESKTDHNYFAGVLPFARTHLESSPARFAHYDLCFDRFLTIGTSTVYDLKLHVIWYTKSQKAMSFWNAVSFAVNMDHDNIKVWRLASYQELQSLYDPASRNRYSPFARLEGTEHHTRDEKDDASDLQFDLGRWRVYTEGKNEEEPFVCVF